jgi:hypothetical protein
LFTDLKDSVNAYKKLNELMLSHTPVDGYSYALVNALEEHPAMTKTLFPAWLKLAADSNCGGNICALARKLVDSNRMKMSHIANMKDTVIAASAVVRKYHAGVYYNYKGMIELLAAYNTNNAWDEIKKYQQVNNDLARFTAIKQILEHGLEPDKQAIDSLASGKLYRTDIYDILEQHGKVNLFPKRYAKQKFFAESDLYNILSGDDNDYGYMQYLGERTVKYKGEEKRFILFEVKVEDTSTNAYLGVAGPYSTDQYALKIDQENNIVGVYTDDVLDRSKLDKLLEAYINKNEAPPPPPPMYDLTK